MLVDGANTHFFIHSFFVSCYRQITFIFAKIETEKVSKHKTNYSLSSAIESRHSFNGFSIVQEKKKRIIKRKSETEEVVVLLHRIDSILLHTRPNGAMDVSDHTIQKFCIFSESP